MTLSGWRARMRSESEDLRRKNDALDQELKSFRASRGNRSASSIPSGQKLEAKELGKDIKKRGLLYDDSTYWVTALAAMITNRNYEMVEKNLGAHIAPNQKGGVAEAVKTFIEKEGKLLLIEHETEIRSRGERRDDGTFAYLYCIKVNIWTERQTPVAFWVSFNQESWEIDGLKLKGKETTLLWGHDPDIDPGRIVIPPSSFRRYHGGLFGGEQMVYPVLGPRACVRDHV